MSTTTAIPQDKITALFEDALRLPSEMRGELATLLLDSLDDSYEGRDLSLTELPPGFLTDELKAELDRRMKSIDDGTAKLIPAEEVFRSIYQRLENGEL